MPEELLKLLQTFSIENKDTLLKTLFSQTKSELLLGYYLNKEKTFEYLALGRFKHIKDQADFDQLTEEEVAIGSHFFDGSYHFIVPDYFIKRSKQLENQNEFEIKKLNLSAQALESYFYHDEKRTFSLPCVLNSVTPQESEWRSLILRTTKILKSEKDKEKVVLGKKITLKSRQRNFQKDFMKLSNMMPSCHHFYLSLKIDHAFLCMSPETLYKKNDKTVTIDTLAGTRPRGKTFEEDQVLENELLHDPKDLREHHIVSGVIHQKLAPLGEVSVGKTKILKLENVQHLHTPIQLLLKQTTDPLNLTHILHPTPALGGYPDGWAYEYIKEHEPFTRHMFASPMGIISNKNAELVVGIRSAYCEPNNVSIFGGCGIVAESEPGLEWDEINAKIGFIKDFFIKG